VTTRKTCAWCRKPAWKLDDDAGCPDCAPLVASVQQRLASGELCHPRYPGALRDRPHSDTSQGHKT
jgi:hypothetical protein